MEPYFYDKNPDLGGSGYMALKHGTYNLVARPCAHYRAKDRSRPIYCN